MLQPILIAALVFAPLTVATEAGGPGCVDWGNAAAIIAQNKLIPAGTIYQMVQKKTGGKVVNQSLCKQGNGYVYKLVVLGPTGEVTNLVVDAATGRF
ncbi:MAG: PepSY domain-containing protein [Actinomycetota bacterium]